MRDLLERRQIWIYFGAIALGAAVGLMFTTTKGLGAWITPALVVMLLVTFLQVPLARIGQGLLRLRFLATLVVSNFIAVPIVVAILVQMAAGDTMLRLGICMVLLMPCIDYVITFTHLGQGDAQGLLAATPILLALQMLLLPLYLQLILGDQAASLMQVQPFVEAFLLMIVLPFFGAAALQLWSGLGRVGQSVCTRLGLLPVPATAVVLFLVVASTMPVLGSDYRYSLESLPIYVLFAVVAPVVGWAIARGFGLAPVARRAVAFSSATRNSLVILPLALAVPGAMPILPVVILTQTMVELLAQLVYIRILPKFDRPD